MVQNLSNVFTYIRLRKKNSGLHISMKYVINIDIHGDNNNYSDAEYIS